jgi:hypothetical protein
VAREGSTNELALLVAEFTLLEEQLSVLASAVGLASEVFLGEDILEKLAVDVPDLRVRAGGRRALGWGGPVAGEVDGKGGEGGGGEASCAGGGGAAVRRPLWTAGPLLAPRPTLVLALSPRRPRLTAAPRPMRSWCPA